MPHASNLTDPAAVLAPGYAKILRNDELFGTGQGSDLEDRVNKAFDLLLIRSGLRISPSRFLMLTTCAAITVGGIAFAWKKNASTAALGVIVGGITPILCAFLAQNRRIQEIRKQLPEMVDGLARAARTGGSVEQCFVLVARDTPAPLGEELRRCAGKLDLGMGIQEALSELPGRTGVASLKTLVMALSVHATSGGDLISVLERLSQTVRGRVLHLARLRSLTAAGRTTTVLLLLIPPLLLGFFLLCDPAYFTRLWAIKSGRFTAVTAAVLDFAGIVWVLRILKNSRQT